MHSHRHDETVQSTRIINGEVLTCDALRPQDLSFSGGRITDEMGAQAGARVFDAEGLLVLPGIVDVHGDAFERQLMPRPNVHFPMDVALLETDRQLVANGITTAYHGLTVSWEPGLRSLQTAQSCVREWSSLRPRMLCDTRLHLRWETFALDAHETVSQWLGLDPAPILAFNDHTTQVMEDGPSASKLGTMAERSGLSVDDYRATLLAAWAQRGRVPAAVDRIAAEARRRGVVLLAHDEGSKAERAHYRSLGAAACEFPLNAETASAARAAGEHAVFGAPNVVRNASHNKGLNASEAIAQGLCTVLASDYYYPAPLIAPFALRSRGQLPLEAAWRLVAGNPAAMAGLGDRGEIREGARADVIAVDARDAATPAVMATFVAGRCVYQAGESRWR